MGYMDNTVVVHAGPTTVAASILVLSVSYLIFLAVYRVWFSRISHIPGPKLAAITYYYQAYYDLWPYQGQFMFHCGKLHEHYGPVIRIGPDEVHVNDPDYYSEIYAPNSRRRNKSSTWFWMHGTGQFLDGSSFATLDHDVHRHRRGAMNPYFSKRAVHELETRISEKVWKLRNRLASAIQSGEVIDIYDGTAALTLDVISDYSFGKSAGALDRPDLGKPWNAMLHTGVKFQTFARTFPIIGRNIMTLNALLPSNATLESNKRFFDLVNDMGRYALAEARAERKGMENTAIGSRNVMHSMLQSEALPDDEKSFDRVMAEAFNLIGAGTETTGRTLAVTIYHVLANKDVLTRLLAELRTVMPVDSQTLPSLATLEKLEYLTAVVQEGSRTAHGTAGRQVRIAPDESLQIAGYHIPSGATFSMSGYLVHTHPRYFPEPMKFRPERYLGPEGEQARKHLFPFGKGTRSCLGINLATSELYLTIAAIFGTLELDLVDTTDKDVEIASEYFIGCMPEDSNGVRVKVLGELSTDFRH